MGDPAALIRPGAGRREPGRDPGRRDSRAS